MKRLFSSLLALSASLAPASAALLDQQAQLDLQTFWDNRDWDWYKANLPFFECPDGEIPTTYYYRWELTTTNFRVVFAHADKARSGVTKILAWRE